MKTIILNLPASARRLSSLVALSISAAALLTSCGAQIGTYTETDGVYYDPAKDVLPPSSRPSYDDDVYSYDDEGEYQSNPQYNIANGSRDRSWERNRKYWDRNATSSDWGTYAGNETRYDSFGYSPFDYGYGLGYGFGMGYPYNYYGMYSPYYGYGGWGLSFSLGYGFGSYYNPYWGFGYNPYWGYGGYSPYYGYGYGYGYPSYYGSGYYGYSLPRMRSSSGASFRTGGFDRFGQGNANRYYSNGTNRETVTPRTGGFRNDGYNQNRTYRSQSEDGYRSMPQRQGGFRDNGWNNAAPARSNEGFSRPSGGFSQPSGGFSGGRSSGGFRSGGFR